MTRVPCGRISCEYCEELSCKNQYVLNESTNCDLGGCGSHEPITLEIKNQKLIERISKMEKDIKDLKDFATNHYHDNRDY